MTERRDLYDLTYDELAAWMAEHGQPAYRTGQVFRWLARGAAGTEAMTDVSKELRAALDAEFRLDALDEERRLVSADDSTAKYVFRLPDGNVIESVLMKYHHGHSVCISSQAGCRMGCSFCASTGAGFGRDLTAGEMVAQVARIGADCGARIANVVVMGIGEPFDNYAQLVRFLRLANDPRGLGIGMRHISVSTCGVVPRMLDFTDEGLPVTLSVSLHAPNDEIRRRLMPVARSFPIEDLLDACRRHVERTGRRISFEYSMFQGVNDRPEHARELARRLRGLQCHVNLIPANEFAGGTYRRSRPEAVRAFQEILLGEGVNATVRRELGTDIEAACGQLRRRLEETENR